MMHFPPSIDDLHSKLSGWAMPLVPALGGLPAYAFAIVKPPTLKSAPQALFAGVW